MVNLQDIFTCFCFTGRQLHFQDAMKICQLYAQFQFQTLEDTPFWWLYLKIIGVYIV